MVLSSGNSIEWVNTKYMYIYPYSLLLRSYLLDFPFGNEENVEGLYVRPFRPLGSGCGREELKEEARCCWYRQLYIEAATQWF